VVGDTTLATIQPLLEQRFGGWRAPAEAVPTKNIANVALASKPRVFLIDRPGAEQSQIVAITVAPSRSDADHIRFEVLDALLGGNFISRLNMNLREEKTLVVRCRHAHHRCRGTGHLPRGRRRAD
jgi:zinc protease